MKTIKLSENDIGQILDGLQCRLEAYQKTAAYLSGEEIKDFVIEEVSDLEEARTLCRIYSNLINKIQEQL